MATVVGRVGRCEAVDRCSIFAQASDEHSLCAREKTVNRTGVLTYIKSRSLFSLKDLRCQWGDKKGNERCALWSSICGQIRT